MMAADDDPPPIRPAEPEPGDCCGEGCPNCVFDVYERALARYETELHAWSARRRQKKCESDHDH